MPLNVVKKLIFLLTPVSFIFSFLPFHPTAKEPEIKIIQPKDGASFFTMKPIHFIATYTGNVVNIEWVSSTDGVFGLGSEITTDNLSIGSSVISIRGCLGED